LQGAWLLVWERNQRDVISTRVLIPRRVEGLELVRPAIGWYVEADDDRRGHYRGILADQLKLDLDGLRSRQHVRGRQNMVIIVEQGAGALRFSAHARYPNDAVQDGVARCNKSGVGTDDGR
jgi:hypothetical protein